MWSVIAMRTAADSSGDGLHSGSRLQQQTAFCPPPLASALALPEAALQACDRHLHEVGSEAPTICHLLLLIGGATQPHRGCKRRLRPPTPKLWLQGHRSIETDSSPTPSRTWRLRSQATVWPCVPTSAPMRRSGAPSLTIWRPTEPLQNTSSPLMARSSERHSAQRGAASP